MGMPRSVEGMDKLKAASVNDIGPLSAVLPNHFDEFEDVKLANNMASDTALPYDDKHRTNCLLNFNDEDGDITSHNTPMM